MKIGSLLHRTPFHQRTNTVCCPLVVRMWLFLLLFLASSVSVSAQDSWQDKLAECQSSNYYDWEECRLCLYMHCYPQSQLRDVYKYCFQDYFGLEHLMSDSLAAVRYIEAEIRSADSTDWQRPLFYYPLLKNNYVRVDIGYVRQGIIPLATMVSAMLQSSQPVDYDAGQWHKRWQSLLALLNNPHCKKPLNYDEDYQLIEQTIKSGKYALHHSRLFNETYRQHYRIVRRDVFEQMLLPLIESFESAKPSSSSNPKTLKP